MMMKYENLKTFSTCRVDQVSAKLFPPLHHSISAELTDAPTMMGQTTKEPGDVMSLYMGVCRERVLHFYHRSGISGQVYFGLTSMGIRWTKNLSSYLFYQSDEYKTKRIIFFTNQKLFMGIRMTLSDCFVNLTDRFANLVGIKNPLIGNLILFMDIKNNLLRTKNNLKGISRNPKGMKTRWLKFTDPLKKIRPP